MEPDFSGWATKAGLKCSDGRTIMPDAFKHQDKMTVPLVWQHGHNTADNVLGHVRLENREGGVYCHAFFNDAPQGLNAKKLVQHKDITALSIYANQLVERSKQVLHGVVREVSLVLSGANPGALIDYVSIAHSGGDVETLEDEAVIYSGLDFELAHSESDDASESDDDQAASETDDDTDDSEGNSDSDSDTVEHGSLTIQQVYDSMNDSQKDVVNYMIGAAIEENGGVAAHAATGSGPNGELTVQDVYDAMTDDQKTVVQFMIGAALDGATSAAHAATTDQEGNEMPRNVFEQNGVTPKGKSLSHDQLKTIVDDAQKLGSLKESFLAHAGDYGIDDIDILFPDAQSVTSSPELIARRQEWVTTVINGTKHSPFSRIKSTAADITAEAARAKGYVKGNLKKDEVIRLLKRVTTPTTIYKKQKLDRDDIVDITDLDVVAWLKAEMRIMLDEELARALLIGDGREADDEDKIDEQAIRPIAYDDDMYATKVNIQASASAEDTVEAIIRARKSYKGTGRPTFFTTDDVITDLLLIKDKMGRYTYNTEAELAAKLRVDSLVAVEVMEDEVDLIGILVNLSDYTLGADRGGNVSMFDDFDIDYNQYKYLIETRCSGALTKPKSAVVVNRVSGTTVTPTAPGYDAATHTLTVPTIAGVSYFDVTDPMNEVALASGSTPVITETTDVEARPNSGYSFPHGTDSDWTYAYTA